jgi:hypothetical protein
MEKYLKKECTYGAIIGPFFKNPFKTDMVINCQYSEHQNYFATKYFKPNDIYACGKFTGEY